MSYEDVVELAQRDEGILGLILTGSRGRGFAVANESDWDVRLIVRDELRDTYRERLATPHASKVEVVVLSRRDSTQPSPSRFCSTSCSPCTAEFARSTASSPGSSNEGPCPATRGSQTD